MSWLLRKLKSLTRRENPSQGDIIHLYSQETGKDHWVSLADLQGAGGYPDWNSTDATNGEYDIGAKVTYAFKLWESLVDDNETVPSENGSWTEVSSATTTFEKIYERVPLTAHGFVVGNCLKKASGIDSWALIDGTADEQEELRGLVISVPDANNFVVALPASRVRGLAGLTPGAIHYASAVGVLTTSATDVKVLFADTATTGYMIAGGGSGGGGTAATTTFTPAGGLSATDVQAAIEELDAEKAADADVVHDTGNETIAGVKTFSSFPVTPSSTPSTDYEVANKKYVDDQVVNESEYAQHQAIWYHLNSL